MKKTGTISYSLRIPKELHDRVKAMSESQRRSVNQQYLVLVESAIEQIPQSKPKTEN